VQVGSQESPGLVFGGQIDLQETAAELAGSFPTVLAAEAGLVAGAANRGDISQEAEESGTEEVPIFGAGGEEGAKG